MKPSEFLKRLGIRKLCEECNWDARDIRLHLKRECEISPKNMSRVMRQIKNFLYEHVAETTDNTRLKEFLTKLRGEIYGG